MRYFFTKTAVFICKCLIASSIGAALGLTAYLVAKEVTLSEKFRQKISLKEEFLPLEGKPIRILDWRNK